MTAKQYVMSKEAKTKKGPLLCWDLYQEEIHKTTNIESLPVGGFLKQSMIDYPGNIAAVVFTRGCNFRCGYCHNPDLVIPEKIRKSEKYDVEDILRYIKHHASLLDAVVITGGEPTLHGPLPCFLEKIREKDLKVKLDTNGTHPDMLKRLIDNALVDYVAMDVKAPLSIFKYREIAGNSFNRTLMDGVIKSIQILNQGLVDHEFRTTLDPRLSMEDIKSIMRVVRGKYNLQQMHKKESPQEILPPSFSMEGLHKFISRGSGNLEVRIRE